MSEKDKEKTATESEEEKTKEKEGETVTVKVLHGLLDQEKKTDKPKKDDIPPEVEKKDETPKKDDDSPKKDVPAKDEPPEVKQLKETLEAEKKRREELELIVEASATKAFEQEKDAFLSMISDEEKRKEIDEKIGDDPELLQDYQRMTSFLKDMLEKAGVKVTGVPEKEGEGNNPTKKDGEGEKHGGEGEEGKTDEEESGEGDDDSKKSPTAGKATLPATLTGANSYKAFVDELYDIIKDPTKTAKEKKLANQKIDSLFYEVFRAVKETGKMPHLPKTSACPNCGYPLGNPETDTCPQCGWKHRVR